MPQGICPDLRFKTRLNSDDARANPLARQPTPSSDHPIRFSIGLPTGALAFCIVWNIIRCVPGILELLADPWGLAIIGLHHTCIFLIATAAFPPATLGGFAVAHRDQPRSTPIPWSSSTGAMGFQHPQIDQIDATLLLGLAGGPGNHFCQQHPIDSTVLT
jgi:hypothetical protein